MQSWLFRQLHLLLMRELQVQSGCATMNHVVRQQLEQFASIAQMPVSEQRGFLAMCADSGWL